MAAEGPAGPTGIIVDERLRTVCCCELPSCQEHVDIGNYISFPGQAIVQRAVVERSVTMAGLLPWRAEKIRRLVEEYGERRTLHAHWSLVVLMHIRRPGVRNTGALRQARAIA